jgi:hypothetical protein
MAAFFFVAKFYREWTRMNANEVWPLSCESRSGGLKPPPLKNGD